VFKDFAITERMKFRFGAEFNNVINHTQLIPGSNPGQGLGVNDVTRLINTFGSSDQSYLTPGDPHFNDSPLGVCQQLAQHRSGREVHLLTATGEKG